MQRNRGATMPCLLAPNDLTVNWAVACGTAASMETNIMFQKSKLPQCIEKETASRHDQVLW